MSVQRKNSSIMAYSFFPILALLLFSIPALAADEVKVGWTKVIDYGQAGYSETGNAWRTYPAFGHNGSYRYLSHYNYTRTRKGTATWATEIPASGIYRVSVSYRRTENRSPDADYYVTNSEGGENHYSFNQMGPNETYMWKLSGLFHYSKGQKVRVFLDGTDDTYSDCADAASWELVELDPAKIVPATNLLLLGK